MLAPHLAVDAMCPRLSKKDVKKMLLELCEACKMHPISKPEVVFGADYNPGVSGFIFIEFSNIAIHTFERDDRTSINIDIFSCKEFSKKDILKYLRHKNITNISAKRHWRNIMVL